MIFLLKHYFKCVLTFSSPNIPIIGANFHITLINAEYIVPPRVIRQMLIGKSQSVIQLLFIIEQESLDSTRVFKHQPCLMTFTVESDSLTPNRSNILLAQYSLEAAQFSKVNNSI